MIEGRSQIKKSTAAKSKSCNKADTGQFELVYIHKTSMKSTVNQYQEETFSVIRPDRIIHLPLCGMRTNMSFDLL